MTSATKNRKPRQRSIRLDLPIGSQPGEWGVIEITQDRKASRYYIEAVPSDFGVGFLLRKIGGTEEYHVNLSAEGHNCECKGFLRWNHCKHTDGLAALQRAGKL
jgi:hypothetical protein